MLKSIKIKNFRILEDFHIEKLGRVNLIVGKNNSGKSTVLEALRIYAQQASVFLLEEIIAEHDENISSVVRITSSSTAGADVPYQNFFPGRRFPEDSQSAIYIGTVDESDFLRIEHVYYIDEFEEVKTGDGEVLRRRRREIVPKGDPTKESSIRDRAPTGQALVVSSSRAERQTWIDLERGDARRFGAARGELKEVPLSYVPTQFLPEDHLAELWDSIALTENDAVVIRALKIIDPDVEGVAFVKREPERTRRPTAGRGERTAIIKIRGQEKPITLSSMGDGMLRVLQLALAMFPAKGGIFLVDELENGLHYSVQHKIWELIFGLAVSLDIQVFAATHSWDCIEAFKNAAIGSNEEGVLFRVGKSVRSSDYGRVIATVFDESRLEKLTQADVEVR